MKILVTGANGQLGREVIKQGAAHEIVSLVRADLDITDGRAVTAFVKRMQPDAVVHCAAYTNVDGAETDEDNAFKVNAVSAQNFAAACLETGAKMVYVSTDYVFAGNSEGVCREFDAVNPQTVYGRTKQCGEALVRSILGRHYIVRTAWLYGEGNNFVRTMLKLANEHKTLKVVHDQIGTPTSTVDLSRAIYRLLGSEAYGTYHATCQGQCSWYEFACEIFRQANKDVEVLPVTTSEFPRPAKRPANSVLDNYMLRMTVGDPMRSWQEALAEYLQMQ